MVHGSCLRHSFPSAISLITFKPRSGYLVSSPNDEATTARSRHDECWLMAVAYRVCADDARIKPNATTEISLLERESGRLNKHIWPSIFQLFCVHRADKPIMQDNMRCRPVVLNLGWIHTRRRMEETQSERNGNYNTISTIIATKSILRIILLRKEVWNSLLLRRWTPFIRIMCWYESDLVINIES